MKKVTYLIIAIALSLVTCKAPVLPVPEFTSGSADFSTFVTLGNSVTAGYADGQLYKSGQENGFANLLARQMQVPQFNIPWVSDDVGVLGPHFVLGMATDCLGQTSLGPVLQNATPDPSNLLNIYATQGPFHNMGVPGIRAIHMGIPGYGALNPYFGRMASGPMASVIGDAMALNPTFFTIWLGNNDVLMYALSGGNDANLPNMGISDANLFQAAMTFILDTLTSNGAKGVVANIPDITGIPFFNTIPYNGLVLDQATADLLNAAYQAAPHVHFQAGPNPFVIADPDHPAGFRQIKKGELLLLSLPQDSLKCAQWGSVVPIPVQYVLDSAEVTAINNAITQFNQILSNLANQYGLAYFDVNNFFQSVKTGLTFNGITLSAEFVSGGAFSLDGIHLTPRGNALIANEFIKVINAAYGSTIPWVDVTQYPGVLFP